MKSVFKKTPNGLVPDSEEAQVLFDKIPDNALVMVEYNKNRNPLNHKRFFKFLSVAFDMQDDWDNPEILRKMLTIYSGHCDMVILPNPDWLEWSLKYLDEHLGGNHKDKVIDKFKTSYGVQFLPISIAFDEMKEEEFKVFFKDTITAFLNRYGGDMTEDEFMKIINFD